MPSLRSLILSPGSLQAEADHISNIHAIRDVVVKKEELKRMASLASVADRIKTKKALYAAKAEGWAARLDKLDAAEPDAFAATDAAIAAHETDLSGMEADMRALTNGNPTS